MWHRRDWMRHGIRWGALAGWSSLAGPGWPQPQTPSDPAVPAQAPRALLAIDRRENFAYLPLTLADRLGYFAEEGLEVHIRDWGTPSAALQAVQAGASDVLVGAYDAVLQTAGRASALSAFVVLSRAPQLVLGVARGMTHYRSFRDLRGKRVGVTGLGSPSHRLTRLLLSRAGIAANEVQYDVLSANGGALTALRAGHVDAVCYTDPTITLLEQGGDLRVVADTRTVRGCQDAFGGPLPSVCLAASGDFLATHAGVAQSLTHALVRALKWLQTAGPSDLIKAVPEAYFQGDRAVYLAALSRGQEAWVPDGLMPEGGPLTVARALTQLDGTPMPSSAELERSFTNTLARKAKARFRA